MNADPFVVQTVLLTRTLHALFERKNPCSPSLIGVP